MTTSRRTLALSSLLATAALAGCSLVLKAPVVRIDDVQIASIGLTGATAAVRLQVENPNVFALTSSGLTYDLALGDGKGASGDEGEVAWRSLASGESTQVVRVPGRDTVEVTVSVPFDYEELGYALESLLMTGVVRYRLLGDVRFDVPFGTVSVPFEETGDLGL